VEFFSRGGGLFWAALARFFGLFARGGGGGGGTITYVAPLPLHVCRLPVAVGTFARCPVAPSHIWNRT